MDYAALTLLLGIGAAYVLRSLLLEEKTDHFGPFQDYSRWVRFNKGTAQEHVQPVTLFDWIRRFAGVYIVTKDPMTSADWWWWDLKPSESSERFTCTHCLSWWTALPFTLVFALQFRSILIIPAHFAISVISQLAYKVLWDDSE